MNNNCYIDIVNYDKKIHTEFPNLISCNIFEKNTIINVYLEFDRVIDDIYDDIGYDNKGKYISINIGQWHNIQTGKYISVEDFYELDEMLSYDYEFVFIEIKIYIKEDYRVCYHNYMDRKIQMSFIPYNILNFNIKNCDSKYIVRYN